MLIIFIILLGTIKFDCVESSTFAPKNRVDVTLYTVDIEFRDGGLSASYKRNNL